MCCLRAPGGTKQIIIFSHMLAELMPSQQTQHIYITFVQCRTNVKDVGPTLHKCYSNVLWSLGWQLGDARNIDALWCVCSKDLEWPTERRSSLIPVAPESIGKALLFSDPMSNFQGEKVHFIIIYSTISKVKGVRNIAIIKHNYQEVYHIILMWFWLSNPFLILFF